MDKDEMLAKIMDIGEKENLEEVRAELKEVHDAVESVYNTSAELTEQHERDTKEMEAIRQANMKLFTQLGTDKTPAKQVEEETGLKQETVNRRKFEDLLRSTDIKGNKLFK